MPMKLTIPLALHNGRAGTKPSYRAVAIRPQGDIRFVEGVNTEGSPYEQCSYQLAYPNDIIIQMSWYEFERKSKMMGWVVRGDGIIPCNQETTDAFYERLPEELKQFLIPIEYGTSYLPPGKWWRGNEMHQFINPLTEDELNAFFEGVEDEWKEYFVAEALKSPAKYINTNWERTKELPTLLKNTMYRWGSDDNMETYVLNSSVWVLYHDNGSIEVRDIPPTKGTHCAGPNRKISAHYYGQPIPMPKSVVRAIRVNLGAFEADGKSYGAKFYLHERPKCS